MSDDDDLSMLLDDESIIPATLDDYAMYFERRHRALDMMLRNTEIEEKRFWQYVHDPFVDLEVFYDQDTKSYILSVTPVKGKAYQDALNEKLGIYTRNKKK